VAIGERFTAAGHRGKVVPRGIAHPPELRAAVVAAAQDGASVSEAAEQFQLDRTLVWRWTHVSRTVATHTDNCERAPEDLTDLTARVYGYVVATQEAMAQHGPRTTRSASRRRPPALSWPSRRPAALVATWHPELLPSEA
jgi:hypothetical protein